MAGMERGSWAYSGSSRNVYWIYLESRPCSQANARALLKPSLEAQHTPRPSPTFTACQGVFLTSCADLFRKYNTTAPQFTEGGEPRPHPLCSYRWTRFHLLTCDCFCLCLPAQGADRLVMPSAFSDRLTTWPALSRRGRGGRCAHCPMFAQDQPRCSATRLSAYVFCARITTSGLAVIPSSCSRITDGSFWGRCDLNNQPDRQPETSAPCAPRLGPGRIIPVRGIAVRGIAARALPCPRPMVSAPAEAFCGGRRGAYTLRHGRG
jgi:hypothetical protein